MPQVRMLITVFFLVFAAVLPRAFASSPGTSICAEMFSISHDEQVARAGKAAIAANPKLIQLLERNAFSNPRVIVFVGPSRSGKTYSLVEGVFTVLNSDGISTALKRVEYISDLVRATDEVPIYRDVRVLAISHVDFTALNYGNYKDLGRVIRKRYALGLSTILLTRDEDTVSYLNELLDRWKPQGWTVEAVEFERNDGLSVRH